MENPNLKSGPLHERTIAWRSSRQFCAAAIIGQALLANRFAGLLPSAFVSMRQNNFLIGKLPLLSQNSKIRQLEPSTSESVPFIRELLNHVGLKIFDGEPLGALFYKIFGWLGTFI